MAIITRLPSGNSASHREDEQVLSRLVVEYTAATVGCFQFERIVFSGEVIRGLSQNRPADYFFSLKGDYWLKDYGYVSNPRQLLRLMDERSSTQDRYSVINPEFPFRISGHGVEVICEYLPGKGQRRERFQVTAVPVVRKPDLESVLRKDLPEGALAFSQMNPVISVSRNEVRLMADYARLHDDPRTA